MIDNKNYDYLIVGAGLFGAIFAHEATRRGKKCLVIEKRPHIAGNIYTSLIEGIHVHTYGAHIFHTSDEEVWQYINQFATFNRFTNSPLAVYKNELYHLPFNMNTFHEMWGVKTPAEAKAKIAEQVAESKITSPQNLEEQAISLVGKDIYVKLIKGYTEKQWGRKATELPAFIIKRLPVRFTYNNDYFTDTYQGIPIGGYTAIIAKLLEGIEVRLNTDFFLNREAFSSIAKKIIFTGMIDQYYHYAFGELAYRSLRFEHETLPIDNYQGNAVINYTEFDVPYTRIIEHKHFDDTGSAKTVITREYPASWHRGDEPYYPINDEVNNALYQKYAALAKQENNVIFGGRLGGYKYYDMHIVIKEALKAIKNEFNESIGE